MTHYEVPDGVTCELIPIGDVTPLGSMLRGAMASKIDKLADYMRRGVPLPPIHLQSGNLIGDGHHRYFASLQIGFTEIPVVRAKLDANPLCRAAQPAPLANTLIVRVTSVTFGHAPGWPGSYMVAPCIWGWIAGDSR